MTNPYAMIVDDNHWDEQMAKDGVEAAYPIGAYVITDDDGVPDADDRVRIKLSLWRVVVRHYNQTADRLTWAEMRAIGLLFHEFGHTKVPSWSHARDHLGWTRDHWEAHRDSYSHPPSSAGLGKQILHAIESGFGINAFTRWMRFRMNRPAGLWAEGEEWVTWLLQTPEAIQ